MIKKVTFILLLGFIFRLFLSVQIYSGDVNNHIAWAKDLLSNGPRGIYQREFFFRYGTLPPTYPPLSLFLFSASHWLFETSYDLSWKLNLNLSSFPSNVIYFLEDQDTLPAYYKIWAIAADLGIAIMAYLFSKKMVDTYDHRIGVFALVAILFNPGIFYNSAYWGQIESIPIFFLMASCYLIFFSQRYIAASLLIGLALLSKQSSIIFAPFFLSAIWVRFGLKKTLVSIFSLIALLWISFLPFYEKGNLLTFPFYEYAHILEMGSGSDRASDHAFNLWALVTNFSNVSDKDVFLIGIPYILWGVLAFGLVYSIAIVKLLKNPDFRLFIYGCLTISIGAFSLLTKMHERYLEPALPFLLLVGLGNKKLMRVFVFVSLFHFINLYHNWWAPRFDPAVTVLTDLRVIRFLIILFLTSFIYVMVQFIRIRPRLNSDNINRHKK